jgi:hypothetical protein
VPLTTALLWANTSALVGGCRTQELKAAPIAANGHSSDLAVVMEGYCDIELTPLRGRTIIAYGARSAVGSAHSLADVVGTHLSPPDDLLRNWPGYAGPGTLLPEHLEGRWPDAVRLPVPGVEDLTPGCCDAATVESLAANPPPDFCFRGDSWSACAKPETMPRGPDASLCGASVGRAPHWTREAQSRLPDGTLIGLGQCAPGVKMRAPGDVLFVMGTQVIVPPPPADKGWGQALWVERPRDVYATVTTSSHERALVLRFDGENLSLVPCPAHGDALSVTGSVDADLWVVDSTGSLWHRTRTDGWTEVVLPRSPTTGETLFATQVQLQDGELWVSATATAGALHVLLRTAFAGKPYRCTPNGHGASTLSPE